MTEQSGGGRVIEVNQSGIGPAGSAAETAPPAKARRLPARAGGLPRRRQALFQSAVDGPADLRRADGLGPHLFTEEEAGAVRHLGMVVGRTAAHVAREEHRPVDQVERVLDRLAKEKRCIVRGGPLNRTAYRVLPIVPGTFEMVLIGRRPETLTDWHRGSSSGSRGSMSRATAWTITAQTRRRWSAICRWGGRSTPIPWRCRRIGSRWSSTASEVFGVGQCQCRLATLAQGRGCGKPLGNCAVMGQWATSGIRSGYLRQVSKEEMLDIKREAEAPRHGQLDDERRGDQGPELVLVLRVLLPRDADGQRVQRPGPVCAAPFPAAPGRGEVHPLRPLRPEVSHGGGGRRRAGQKRTITRSSAASAAGCARWRAGGRGRFPWSRCPTTSCPIGAGTRCFRGPCRACSGTRGRCGAAGVDPGICRRPAVMLY